MTGDKFRARADEYVKAARSVAEPVRKVALMDIAQRWLRLAAQIDAAACTVMRTWEAPARQVAQPATAGPAAISRFSEAEPEQ